MNKKKFIRLSGWALILGALTFILAFAAGNIQEYNPYDALSRPVDRYFGFLSNAVDFLVPSALFLISLGISGMYFRYSNVAGKMGRNALVAAGIGSMGTLLVYVFSLFSNAEYLWGVMMIGMILAFGGIAVFGLSAIKARFLPRWNYLPFLAGIWLPILIVISLIYELLTGKWFAQPVVDILGFGLTGVGLFALGYLLQGDAQENTLTTV